jgi:prevent-host-death family protein
VNTVNIHNAKTNLSKLVEAAERGEETIIARNGKPVARIVPIAPPLVPAGEKNTPGMRLRGALKGKVEIVDPDWWKPDDGLADLFENGKVLPEDFDASR